MPDSEIFTAAKPGEILGHAEILVLRQMSDTLSGMRGEIKGVSSSVADVRERVIKIEAAGLMQQLATMGQSLERACGRIDALESERDKRSGMTDLLGWAMRNTPWLIALGGVTSAFFLKRR